MFLISGQDHVWPVTFDFVIGDITVLLQVLRNVLRIEKTLFTHQQIWICTWS